VLVVGCVLGLEPPSDPPAIVGVITELQNHETRGLRVLVEEQPGVYAGDKLWLAVRNASILVREAEGSWRKGSVEDLQVGALAQAWEDPEFLHLDSYPGQAVAKDIAILEPPRP
jgi:hypothetical protein